MIIEALYPKGNLWTISMHIMWENQCTEEQHHEPCGGHTLPRLLHLPVQDLLKDNENKKCNIFAHQHFSQGYKLVYNISLQ
jgi:hypothetical protein